MNRIATLPLLEKKSQAFLLNNLSIIYYFLNILKNLFLKSNFDFKFIIT